MHRRLAPPSRRRPTPPCLIESLERRALLAVDLVGDVLQITGTNKNDTITVALSAGDPTKLDVTLNGATTTHDLTPATGGVRVSGGNGHDRITIEGSLPTTVTLLGGNGNDTLTGGSGADLLDGGNGNDALTGNAGPDTLAGGNGRDSLVALGGDDSLSGDAGNDSLRGGNGKDSCDGGAGNDTVSGDNGNDTLAGGASDDSLAGGKGDDSVRGGSGRDRLRGDDGDDDCDGDSGTDDVDGGNGSDDVGGGRGRDKVRGGAGRDRFGSDDDNSERDDRGKDDDRDENISPADLPDAVTASFNEAFPGATITKAERDLSAAGQTTGYEVDFTLAGQSGKAEFTAAGTLREADIALAHAPATVQSAFNTAHPNATVTRVQAERNPAGTLLYKIRYTNPGSTDEQRALFTPTGTPVSDDDDDGNGNGDDDDSTKVSFNDLPAPVQSALQTVAPGAAYKEIERETEDGQTVYKVKLTTANGTERRYELLPNGTFVD